MTRALGQRFYFLGTLVAAAPFHIGRQGAVDPFGAETDLPVLLDHEGKPYVPATSLGGVLRGTAELLTTTLEGWGLPDVLSLFGGARMGEKGKEGCSSKVRIRHAWLKSEWQGIPERRDSVGIDRQRAAAKHGIKFDYEVLPSDLGFALHIELHEPNNQDKQLLTLCLQALQLLHLPIGAKGGSGLGWFEVGIDKVVQVNLTNPSVLFRFLSQETPFDPATFELANEQEGKVWGWEAWCEEVLSGLNWQVKSSQDEALQDEALRARIPQAVVFTYRLRVEDPVLVKRVEAPEFSLEHFLARRGIGAEAPERQQWRETLGIDAVWFGTGTNPSQKKGWHPLLPGSSLRGVFRSHCERILRTLSWHYANGNRSEYKRRVAASDPLESRPESHLRGAGQTPEAQESVTKTWTTVHRGGEDFEQNCHQAGIAAAKEAWRLSDLAERMFGSTLWRSSVLISEACAVSEDWQEQLFDHVAVERFSGGAAAQKKFNTLPITHATFEGKMVLLGDELWMLGLLALLFKDLRDALVRIGSGKTRGYGKVVGELTKVQVFALPGTQLATALANASTPQKRAAWSVHEWSEDALKAFPLGLPEPLRELLTQAVCELNEKVQGYERPAELRQQGGEKA